MDSAPSPLDQIVALLATPPPRAVSPELKQAALRQSAPWLFVIIGAAVAAFAMIFVAVFFPWNLTRQWRLDAGNSATASGKIIAVERTGMSINKRPVMRFTFEFNSATPRGVVRGNCYTTGSSWAPEAVVTVRYLPDDPSLACVEGARLTQTGAPAAFIVLFPGIGLTMVVVGLRLRQQAIHLLVHGEVAEALVTGLERTGTKIGNNYVYRIGLKRIDRPDDARLETNKWEPRVVAFAQGRLESKQPVFVLFNPKRPKQALFPEVL